MLTCNSDRAAGLKFTNIAAVSLRNISIRKCSNLGSSSLNTNASISITSSESIEMDNVIITNSKGYGCYIQHSANVVIMNTRVENNHGGVYLYANLIHRSNITLENNIFTDNSNVSIHLVETNTRLIIKNCKFKRNEGILGGGLYISLTEVSQANVVIDSSVLEDNLVQARGGGVCIYLTIMRENSHPHISLFLTNTNFYNNTAKYGGGFYFHYMSTTELEMEISIKNSVWKENRAVNAAAVSLYVPFIVKKNPVIIFEDCSIYSNEITRYKYNTKDMHPYELSKAALVSKRHNIMFKGNTTFIKNSGTALSLTSSTLIIETNSSIMFDRNHGNYGGALALYDSSNIVLYPNTSLTFTGNKAERQGGAIFIPRRNNMSTQCIFNVEEVQNGSNYIFKFSNNTVSTDPSSSYGQTIYIYSVIVLIPQVLMKLELSTFSLQIAQTNMKYQLIYRYSKVNTLSPAYWNLFQARVGYCQLKSKMIFEFQPRN